MVSEKGKQRERKFVYSCVNLHACDRKIMKLGCKCLVRSLQIKEYLNLSVGTLYMCIQALHQ